MATIELQPQHWDIDNETDLKWTKEVEKYLPEIKTMTFWGPETTIRWLVEHIREESKKEIK